MRSESATQVLMVRSPNTVVNRATGQVLQSKISAQNGDRLLFRKENGVRNHFAVRGGPVSSNILGHFLYLGLAATSLLSLQYIP